MTSNSFNSSNDFKLAHDPYQKFLQQEKYNKNLIPFDNSTKFAKKINKFKASLWNARNNAMQGAMMGFMVGGLFGLCVGVYSAIQTRRFMAIPISALVSGCSFGFILGCGSMIRTDQLRQHQKQEDKQLEQFQWLITQQFNSKMI